MRDSITMLYAERFSELVAYICADPGRTRVVKELERSGQSLTTKYFMDNLWKEGDARVMELLEGLEAHGIIECMNRIKGKCESWDLTSAGRDVLIAIENPPPTEGWLVTELLRKACDKLLGRPKKKE